jgi:hypothetical protein
MRNQVLCVAAALVLAAMAVPALGAAKGWDVRRQGDLFVIDTPHYQIKTDHEPAVAQNIATHQELVYAELFRRMGRAKAQADVMRYQIYACTSLDRTRQIVDAETSARANFWRVPLTGYGAPEAIDSLFEVLRREGCRQFLAQFMGETCPLWLAQGMTAYFANGEYAGGKLTLGQAPILPVYSLKKMHKEGKLLPLARVLNMGGQEFSAAAKVESSESHAQVVQTWGIIHFLELADRGKYNAPYFQYLALLARRKTHAEAWPAAFGADLAGFERRWIEYITALEPTCGFDCRTNLKLLGFTILPNLSRFGGCKNMAEARAVVLSGGLSQGWTYTLGNGLQVSAGDVEVIKALFRCPEDKSKGDEPSYDFVIGGRDEAPVIRCNHHAGYIIETSLAEDPAKPGTKLLDVITRPRKPGDAPAKTK